MRYPGPQHWCGHSPTAPHLPDPELVPTKQVFQEQSLLDKYLQKKGSLVQSHGQLEYISFTHVRSVSQWPSWSAQPFRVAITLLVFSILLGSHRTLWKSPECYLLWLSFYLALPPPPPQFKSFRCVTTWKSVLRTLRGNCPYTLTALVMAHTRPGQTQARQNSSMQRGDGHELLALDSCWKRETCCCCFIF